MSIYVYHHMADPLVMADTEKSPEMTMYNDY